MSGNAGPKSLGLLGGTFDPVHNGHISIIRSYLQSSLLDHLIVTLTPDPPHKQEDKLTEYSHRLQMLELALSEIQDLSISTIEKELPTPSYTVNTVHFYRDRYPDAELYLCLGEDSFKQFESWHRWQEILSLCALLVARRPGAEQMDSRHSEEAWSHTRFVDHEPIDISSSMLRKNIKNGRKVNDFLPAEVIAYIRKHNLYTY